MAVFIRPQDGIAKQLQEALGLPADLLRLEIVLAPDSVVEVRCTLYPSADAMAKVVEVMKHYRLVPREREA